jgi:hypothetical protein
MASIKFDKEGNILKNGIIFNGILSETEKQEYIMALRDYKYMILRRAIQYNKCATLPYLKIICRKVKGCDMPKVCKIYHDYVEPFCKWVCIDTSPEQLEVWEKENMSKNEDKIKELIKNAKEN